MLMGITDEHFGTEADGKKSEDYCHYCYMDGKFKREVSMTQMLETCVKFAIDDETTEKQARNRLEKILPDLKRWAEKSEGGA